MKVTEISVSANVKFVRFSSAGAEIGLKATLDEGEDIDEVRKELSEMVHDMLTDELNQGITMVTDIQRAIEAADNRNR